MAAHPALQTLPAFPGRAASVRVWRRALLPNEVAASMTRRLAVEAGEPGLEEGAQGEARGAGHGEGERAAGPGSSLGPRRGRPGRPGLLLLDTAPSGPWSGLPLARAGWRSAAAADGGVAAQDGRAEAVKEAAGAGGPLEGTAAAAAAAQGRPAVGEAGAAGSVGAAAAVGSEHCEVRVVLLGGGGSGRDGLMGFPGELDAAGYARMLEVYAGVACRVSLAPGNGSLAAALQGWAELEGERPPGAAGISGGGRGESVGGEGAGGEGNGGGRYVLLLSSPLLPMDGWLGPLLRELVPPAGAGVAAAGGMAARQPDGGVTSGGGAGGQARGAARGGGGGGGRVGAAAAKVVAADGVIQTTGATFHVTYIQVRAAVRRYGTRVVRVPYRSRTTPSPALPPSRRCRAWPATCPPPWSSMPATR